MRIFSPEETESLLPYRKLAEEIRSVALAWKSGAAQAPERMALPLASGGTLLVMPASDGRVAMNKLVSVHPENSSLGLPTIQGEVTVLKAGTGERLGVLDGSVVTARRTAALSMLAAGELAARPEGPLLILGAGTQGRSHLEAFREGLGVREVFIVSRTFESAQYLARHAADLGMEARALESPEEALSEAKLVVTATTSARPVLPDNSLAEDVFIAAVGAFKPETAELPPRLIQTSNVVVDTLEGAKSEAGDLLQAIESGAFEWERAVELQEALEGKRLSKDRAVVFKSVGSALWDLASARTAFG